MSEYGMSLQKAHYEFDKLMYSLEKEQHEPFLNYVKTQWMPDQLSDLKELALNNIKVNAEGSDDDEEVLDDPVATLNKIAEEIKQKIPFEATFPSEKILPPKTGENADCDPNITLHVDEFLYTDDDVDELVDAGKLKRHYCEDCGSKNVKPLIYISHSTSRDCLYHIFDTLLPTLEGKTVLDVGSRLGAVLYGAYVYTDASRIVGVEMNRELCDLQKEIVSKYKMQDRVEVLHKCVEDAEDVVKVADVVILNNVFEFYLPEAQQIETWRFLRNTLKKGALVVTGPRIETTFANLDTGINTKEWLKQLESPKPQRFHGFGMFGGDKDEPVDSFSEIACYEVL